LVQLKLLILGVNDGFRYVFDSKALPLKV